MTPKLFLALGAALLLPVSRPALAAGASDYQARAPAFSVVYNEAQKAAQREKTRAIIGQINRGIKAGQTDFSFAPGVYRIPKVGPNNDFRLAPGGKFTLRVAGCEFFLENDGAFLHYDDYEHQCDIALLGPAKFDVDPLLYTQGRISAYDAKSGLMTIEVAPGYPLAPKAEAVIESYSPQGVYLENPSWMSYKNGRVTDEARRLVQVEAAANQTIYDAGNLVTLINSQPLFFSLRGVKNLIARDLDLYGGTGWMWGSGNGGDWKFERVRGVPRPGTNRLRGVASCQVYVSGGARVLFDGCSFSNNSDDLIDFGGGGIWMNARQNSPREIVTWRGQARVGDALNFYSHEDFLPVGAARVVAVEAIEDDALQAQAHDVVKNINKGRDAEGNQTMQRVTLDRDVSVGAGDFIENPANGASSFTIRNSYFSNSGVRVMVQGFQHGLFENNTFERISGGLALTVDAWWWGGPVVQDVTIRNNVFRQTTFRNGWGTGRAAIAVGADKAPNFPAQSGATHGVTISGNRIFDSSRGAIFVGNATDVTIQNNRITNAQGLQGESAIVLNGVFGGVVTGNTIAQSGGKAIAVSNSSDVKVTANTVAPASIAVINSVNTTATDNSGE